MIGIFLGGHDASLAVDGKVHSFFGPSDPVSNNAETDQDGFNNPFLFKNQANSMPRFFMVWTKARISDKTSKFKR
jgi:hypothetical protein